MKEEIVMQSADLHLWDERKRWSGAESTEIKVGPVTIALGRYFITRRVGDVHEVVVQIMVEALVPKGTSLKGLTRRSVTIRVEQHVTLGTDVTLDQEAEPVHRIIRNVNKAWVVCRASFTAKSMVRFSHLWQVDVRVGDEHYRDSDFAWLETGQDDVTH